MTAAVKLVPPTQVLPSQLGVLALEPGVEVPVRALSARQDSRYLFSELLYGAVQATNVLPGSRFEDLVDIRVREMHTGVRPLGPVLGKVLEVADCAGGPHLFDAVRDGLGSVAPLPIAEGPAPGQHHFAQAKGVEASDRGTRRVNGALEKRRRGRGCSARGY